MDTLGFWDGLVYTLSAICGSMGLGGGSVLLLYLTFVQGLPQIEAQGINLLFFVPCACVSLFFYKKQNLLQWNKIVPMAIGGIFGLPIGSFFLRALNLVYLKILFAAFIILFGMITFFSKDKNQ